MSVTGGSDVDAAVLLAIAPRFSGRRRERQAQIIEEIGPALHATLDAYDITTRLRCAHFLAQCCHECAGFQTTEEFADGSNYKGRKDLGNVKRGDGPRYKGRGILQLTGRANYRQYGKLLGLEVEANPALAADPAISLLIACEYWKKRKINPDADRDDVVTVTRKINGGERGLPERRQFTAKAKAVLARMEGIQMSGAQSDKRPVLTSGSAGEEVGKLQAALRKLGHPIAWTTTSVPQQACGDDLPAKPRTARRRYRRQRDLGGAQGRGKIEAVQSLPLTLSANNNLNIRARHPKR